MKTVPLKAFNRTLSRRGGAKKLRESGLIPAVIYGRRTKPEILEVNAKELEDLMHRSASENILVDLAVNSGNRLALIQDIQHHPLNGKFLHLDLHEVAENELVTVMVPVETSGEPAGVKTGGGVLEHVLFKLKVRALPKDLPEQVLIDVTHLELGKSIHISEIPPIPGVEIIGNPNTPVVAVAMAKAEVEEVAAEGTPVAAGDVEMIKEKKEEGDESPSPAKGAAPAKAAATAKGEAKAGEKAPAAPTEKKK